jgi:hypothetical protein
MEFRQHRDNGDKKPTRYYSSKQENKVAKDVGGKTTANSGATMFDKGDLKTDQFLIECKTKTSNSDSISIKKEWLDKLKDESLFMKKKYEALIFNFGPDSKNYAIIDLELFNILQEYLKSMED